MTDDPLETAYESIPDAPKTIAHQLHMMAAGKTQYGILIFASPWIKNIWNAAADIIEDYERQNMH